MSRRPNIWNIRSHKPYSDRVTNNQSLTNDFAKFDIEKFDSLPFVENQRNKNQYGWTRLYTPIDRFLMRQVGRDYDEVFSELVSHIPEKLRHKIDVYKYKMPSSFHPDATRWYLDNRYYRRRLGESYGFYVDLETRVLGYMPRISNFGLKEIERARPVYQPFKLDVFKVRFDYGQNFVFKQLLTYKDFEDEAVKMQHCIRWYWERCTIFHNKISIWILSDKSGRILTIQISDTRIVQVKGLRNRSATNAERKLIVHWAKWLGLTIAGFVF
jgi:hypothetical protein